MFSTKSVRQNYNENESIFTHLFVFKIMLFVILKLIYKAASIVSQNVIFNNFFTNVPPKILILYFFPNRFIYFFFHIYNY